MFSVFYYFLFNLSIDSTFFNDSLRVINDIIPKPEISSTPTFAVMMLQMIGMLLLLSGLLYFSLFFFKKLNTKIRNKDENLGLKIQDTLYFSNKQGLSVVQFNNIVYIIGFSQNSINLIDKITDPALVEAYKNQSDSKKEFKQIFKNFLSKDSK